MRPRPSTAVLAVLATATLAAGCGGGSKAPATTTSTTTAEPTTTSTTIDPALRDLLLVASDVPEFKEKASTEPEGDDPLARCAPELPAVQATESDPEVEGATFVRGANDAVEVSSSVRASTPEEAEAALNELVETKATDCFQRELRTIFSKDQPAGAEVAPKVTATKSSVAGADQVVLLSTIVTVKGAGGTETARSDLVFLRRDGEIIIVFYGGPGSLTSVAERQRVVAAISKKLGGGTSGTSTTSGSSTSVAGGGSSTTRRATTTTRRATTTTARASTTSTTT